MLVALVAFLVTLATPGTVAFRIADPELIPEGIAYDAPTRTFFVGSTYKRKIVAVDAAGKARDFTKEGQDGAFGFVGLRVDTPRRVLWALSSHAGASMPGRGLDDACNGCSTVMRYDVASGKLLKTYSLPNAGARHFLNDIAIAPSGDAYITDTMTGDIYRITRATDALERWVNVGAQVYPNGIDITPGGSVLFVATEAGLRRIDVKTGAISAISRNVGSIDGLYFHRGSLIAIQPFEEFRKIARFHLTPALDGVAGIDTLEASNPVFRQPTTGVIVGDDFYYIANAQLQAFRAMYAGGAIRRAELADVVVLKRTLDR
ncbi:MAG: SMP-30/gluconolactonase/LRE family protein [Acidobacteriota bacterium]|nr:SMP-30/gluconolactonase/LRE family protein [Acidobacteriota bacterium]